MANRTLFTRLLNASEPCLSNRPIIRRFLDGCDIINKSNEVHVPVMTAQAVKFLNPARGGIIIDMTFGAGGHTKKLLEKSKDIKIFCLDRDPVAYSHAQELKHRYPDQVYPLLGKFSDLAKLLKPYGIKQNSVDGILMDLGCSSMQFDNGYRGFSISKDGPLDMRMNQEEDCLTAADVLERAHEHQLHQIFKIYGEEKLARKIARSVVEVRYGLRPVRTTKELAELVVNVAGTAARLDKLGRRAHVATKTFQGLRIFVNNEVNEINYAMVLARRYLKIGGVLVTLAFHSLEDTIVKRHITNNVERNSANKLPLKFYSSILCHEKESLEVFSDSPWAPINKHVIMPEEHETYLNPRSRSARLRASIKIS